MNNKPEISKEIQSNISMFLMKHGFNIIQKDFLGSIDIVSEKGGEIHFFDIIRVSQETYNESFKIGEYVKPQRLSEIQKTAQLFVREINMSNVAWHIHIIYFIYSKNGELVGIKFLWDFNF